jgi:predicted DNA-binding protein
MKPYQIRLHPDLIERIQAEAKRTRTTASEVVRLALVAYLHKAEQHGTEEA